MPAKRTLIFIALLFVIVFSFSAAMFINLSNDHKECSTLVTKEWDEKKNFLFSIDKIKIELITIQ